MDLSEVIKDYRLSHGLSLRSFAARAGLSATYIMSLENGRTARGNKPAPSLETYRAIAKAMSMDLDSLLKAVDGEISILPTNPDPAEKLLYYFGLLNVEGKRVAEERVQELTEIPKYQEQI